jgi:hypothetical protein
MGFPLLSRMLRMRRIHHLVDEIEIHEARLRDLCSALIELSDPDDDLHVEIVRLLEALDG